MEPVHIVKDGTTCWCGHHATWHTKVQTSCPDGRRGCAVFHGKWICEACESARRDAGADKS